MTSTNDPRHHNHGHRPGGTNRPVRPRRIPPPTVGGDAKAAPATDPAELLLGERLALTVAEAGSLLGISRALAYELVARGELPSVRLGRRLVVPKVAIFELLGLRPRLEP